MAVEVDAQCNALRIVLAVVFVLSYVLVLVRIYIRCRLTRRFGADDIFLLAALASFSVLSTAGWIAVDDGIGSKIANSDDTATLYLGLHSYFVAEIMSISTITILRIAVALQLRLLSKTSRQRWFLFTLMALSIAYNAGYFLLVLFQSVPSEYTWTSAILPKRKVVDQNVMAGATDGYAVLGAIVDWALAIAPAWLAWNRAWSSGKRWCVRFLMILGLCAGIVALVRIPETIVLLRTEDFFSDCAPLIFGSIVECGLGMAAMAASTFSHLYPAPFDKPLPRPKLQLEITPESKSLCTCLTCQTSLSAGTGVQIAGKHPVHRKFSEKFFPED